MEDLILKLVYDVLTILITLAVSMVIAWLKKKVGVEGLEKIKKELEAKQEIALLAVKAVEQLWGGVLHGDDKVRKAAEIISAQAAKLGLKISEDEIRELIEWAVRTMKDEFGEQWAKILTNP